MMRFTALGFDRQGISQTQVLAKLAGQSVKRVIDTGFELMEAANS